MPVEGYVADVYLEPVSGGGGGTGERWRPFGKEVGYLKGYRFRPPIHVGIDLISANDPDAVLITYSTNGFSYITWGTCPITPAPNPVNGRQVYAVADGRIDKVYPVGSDSNTSLVDQTDSNGNSYWVQYTHVEAAVNAGQQVYKGVTLIGWYGFYGAHGGVAHLHLTLKENGQLADPERYLPDTLPVFPPGPFPIWGL